MNKFWLKIRDYHGKKHTACPKKSVLWSQINCSTAKGRLGKLEGHKLEGQTPRKAHFTRVCDSRRRQRSWHHCQQLGDLLRVAGGVGSDAMDKAVDGRAKAMQLRDKRSRLIATPNCNSHVEADNGNLTFSPPRQICRAPFTARAKILARNHHSRGLPSPYIQTR